MSEAANRLKTGKVSPRRRANGRRAPASPLAGPKIGRWAIVQAKSPLARHPAMRARGRRNGPRVRMAPRRRNVPCQPLPDRPARRNRAAARPLLLRRGAADPTRRRETARPLRRVAADNLETARPPRRVAVDNRRARPGDVGERIVHHRRAGGATATMAAPLAGVGNVAAGVKARTAPFRRHPRSSHARRPRLRQPSPR